MKRLILLAVVISSIVSFAASPTVSNVRMRQRYPWNALVDIDYEISGDVNGVSVEFSVGDRQNGKTYKPTKFISAPTVNVGWNRATWDVAADGVNVVSTNIVVTVYLLKATVKAPTGSGAVTTTRSNSGKSSSDSGRAPATGAVGRCSSNGVWNGGCGEGRI